MYEKALHRGFFDGKMFYESGERLEGELKKRAALGCRIYGTA